MSDERFVPSESGWYKVYGPVVTYDVKTGKSYKDEIELSKRKLVDQTWENEDGTLIRLKIVDGKWTEVPI